MASLTAMAKHQAKDGRDLKIKLRELYTRRTRVRGQKVQDARTRARELHNVAQVISQTRKKLRELGASTGESSSMLTSPSSSSPSSSSR